MDKELLRLPEYIQRSTVTKQIDPYRIFERVKLKEKCLPTLEDSRKKLRDSMIPEDF